MKTILVGYGGGDSSRRALERAVSLAQALGAQLVVSTVDPPFPPALATPVGLADPMIGPAPGMPVPAFEPPLEQPSSSPPELADVRALLEARGIEAELVPARGDPAETIVELADARKADLIVVGSTAERGFLDRILAGSVSNDVSRRAHCDVLLVH